MAHSNNQIGTLIDEARRRHMSGDIRFAREAYRAILDNKPEHSEALYLLGICEHQTGNHADALDLLQQAADLDPNNPKIDNNLGSVYLAMGFNQLAHDHFQRAAEALPDDGEIALNLGLTLHAIGKDDMASAEFTRACALMPNDPEVWFRKGNHCEKLKQPEDAVACYQEAVRLRADFVPALQALGSLWVALNRPDDGEECFRAILSFIPEFYPAVINLGTIAHAKGEFERALEIFQKALSLRTDDADLFFRLAAIYQELSNITDAVDNFRRGLSLDPSNFEAWYVLGEIFTSLGDADEAVRCYQKCTEIQPDSLSALWRTDLNLPVVYRSTDEIASVRDRFTKGLLNCRQKLNLSTTIGVRTATEVLEAYTNFYLPYQGYDDIDLQREYAGIIHDVSAHAFPRVAQFIANRNARKRIGFVSSNLHNGHTIQKLFTGWMALLDKNTFESHAVYVGDSSELDVSEISEAGEFIHHGWTSTGQTAQSIYEMDFDALIYLDVAMSPRTQMLAAQRLSPVQCATWGHPTTTGFRNIDHFLTSDLMEPDNGNVHYTENLVRLPNLSISYARPDFRDATVPKFVERHSQAPVYLCSQSLFKLLPQFDTVFAKIAKAAGDCHFWFIETRYRYANELFKKRLNDAFEAHGLRGENYFTIHPQMNFNVFLGLNQKADVLLDSFLWSGGNTTLEALGCGLPVVSCPGPMMRGRHTFAMLKRMDMPELIAEDVDAYIDIAANLARDSNLRKSMSEKIKKRNYLLYGDREAVAGLNQFLTQTVR